MKPWLRLAVNLACATGTLLLVVAMAACSGTTTTNTASKPTKPAANVVPSLPDPVTLGNFYRVETGMTADEVLSILGTRCELSSQVDIADIQTALITWHAEGFAGGNCNVTFQNGRVVGKAQFGLTGDENDTALIAAKNKKAEDAPAEPPKEPPPALPVEVDGRSLGDLLEAEEGSKVVNKRGAYNEETAPTVHPLRTWQSPNGKFFREARFVRYKNGKVTLQMADGEEFEVEASKLSQEDRDWLEARR